MQVKLVKINSLVPLKGSMPIDAKKISGIDFDTWKQGPSYKPGEFYVGLTYGSAVCLGDTHCQGRVYVIEILKPYEFTEGCMRQHRRYIGDYDIDAEIITTKE